MISPTAIHELAASLQGQLLSPNDAQFDSARRVFNSMIDRKPALIARCAGSADVIACVHFAGKHDLRVAVRGGGHGIAGNAVCDQGLVIDLSQMKGISVDPKRRTARAEPGVTLGEFDAATQAFGLATTLGTVSVTGIAGLTLGGGLGWLMGKYGLACDNLLSVDIVMADGRLLAANDRDNADLFWGVRGGGGNFGVVTSLEYQLHEVGPVLAGLVGHPPSKAHEVLRFYREIGDSCPDELVLHAAIVTLPDGNTITALAGCYSGSMRDGEKVLWPVRSFGPPAADLFREMPYTEAQQLLDWAFPAGRHHYWKSGFLQDLNDDAIEVVVDFGSRKPSPHTIVLIEHMHGAARRRASGDTAFSHREAPYSLLLLSTCETPGQADANLRWTREFWDALRPFMRADVYVNYMSEGETEDRVRGAYGANYARLAALKNKFDPANFFRMNQNVKPTATGLEALSA